MKVLNEGTLECLIIKNVMVQNVREAIELQILNCFSSKFNEQIYSKSLKSFEFSIHWTESTKLTEESFSKKFGLDSFFNFFKSLKSLEHIEIICGGHPSAV